MYFKVQSRVRVDLQVYTEAFPCKKGVRQECSMSPLLFNLFVSDLQAYLEENCVRVRLNEQWISILMFANYLMLLSSSENGLKKHLKTLESYCKKWELRQKTSIYLVTIRIRRYLCGKAYL